MVVRGQFVDNGKLSDTNDTNYRPISDNWPVFAFCADLGQVGGSPVTVPVSIGQVRTPAVSYLGQDLQPLWTSYFSSWQDMLGFFHADLTAARQRADRLDATHHRGREGGGRAAYAGLCALALRQAYGGTELWSARAAQPWAFLKEISSDGNVSTVDVAVPGLAGVDLRRPRLPRPAAGAAAGLRRDRRLAQDLRRARPGLRLPQRRRAQRRRRGGHAGRGVGQHADHVRRLPPAGRRRTAAVVRPAHYPILKQWADYLVANLPDPGFQNQTDDFTGFIAHSVNLALKGIIAVAAMGQIATAAGNTADAAHYAAQARQYIAYWASHAQDPGGTHLDLTYSGSDGGNGTWGTTYNAYADRLLGTEPGPQVGRRRAGRLVPPA